MCAARNHFVYARYKVNDMSPVFLLLTLLLSSVSARNPILRLAQSATLPVTPAITPTTPAITPAPGPEPICFTPPDLHSVSQEISVCAELIDDFVTSFGTRMNDRLRWTGNNSETGSNMVHLPQVATRRNPAKTGVCLVEVVDRGAGDFYSAASIIGPGLKILNECFTAEKCGEVALPPHGTTTLAICGSYRPNGTTLLRRPVAPDADSEVAAKALLFG